LPALYRYTQGAEDTSQAKVAGIGNAGAFNGFTGKADKKVSSYAEA
jgi:hypothetical protein